MTITDKSAGGPLVVDRQKKTDVGTIIVSALAHQHWRAARLAFRKGVRAARMSDPQFADALQERFGPVMEILALAGTIEGEAGRVNLPERYASSRRRDQRRLVSAVVEHLFVLAAKGRWTTLSAIGESFSSLVLEGTLQQRYCCKIASALAAEADVPAKVIELVALPMINALRVVLRIGAARTRDAAVEGAGALLRLAGDPVGRFAPYVVITDGLGSPQLNSLYVARLSRRREMVLAIADSDSRAEYVAKISEPLEDILTRLRAEESRIRAYELPEEDRTKALEQHYADIETALYGRADRLRILPAVLRQNAGAIPTQPLVELLRRSMNRLQPDSSDPPQVQIAYAACQESVFRTIDVAVRRRSVAWSEFDEAISEVVKRIPRTITGLPPVCNARIRATIATVRTAMTIVQHSDRQSKTKEALFPLINKLTTVRPWLNLGIAEGAYRALPEILNNPNHSNLYKPILKALFNDLRTDLALQDFVRAHRQLSALSCFRRILLSLADDAEERQLKDDPQGEDVPARDKLDRRLRLLLRTPDLGTLQEVLRGQLSDADPDDIAEPIIAGVAYECDLLRAMRPSFQRWDGLATVEKVLLTRIFALQMHAVSRDAMEIARYPFLHKVFTGTIAVVMPDDEPLQVVWDILASLPAGAAEAAEPDIQRFVEHRGRLRRATQDPGDCADDLPGYVLAMISPTVSEKIADGIAREIDLNLRHDQRHHGVADFARPLYQVLLHGPHEAILDHLLPRLKDSDDRRLAMLFRDHVAKVRASEIRANSGRYDVRALEAHASSMALAIGDDSRDTLRTLREVLHLFTGLVSEEEGEVWANIENGNILRFFALLDRLDAMTHKGNAPDVEGHRKPIEPLLHNTLVDLQNQVEHYMSLPVGSFTARSELLRTASARAEQIEMELTAIKDLQPPEKAMLVALAQQLRDLFERTDRWFCKEARRLMESQQKGRFWLLAAYSTDRVNLLMRRLRSGVTERSQRAAYRERETFLQLEETAKVAGPLPPRYLGQAIAFEKFAVDWMSSDLDAASVEDVLGDRWSRTYAMFFETMTSLRKVLLLIMVPCVLAMAMHSMGLHWIEGAGFYVLSAAVVLAVVIGCTQFIDRLIRNPENLADGHWLESVFPRLGRLIVVPMAVMVEFDHSYEFPATVSTWALLLLLMIAFLVTQFAIGRLVKKTREPAAAREKKTRNLQPGEEKEQNRADRKKARRIVAVALSYSFAAAVLFSIIFADSHHQSGERGESLHAELTHEGDHPELLGLPRRAFLDFATLSKSVGLQPGNFIEHHGQFTFYPIVLLTWTAFGLFFGLVLEGIFKGESHLGEREEERLE